MLSSACASRCVTALLSLLCLLTAFDLLQQLQQSALAQSLGHYASVLRASDVSQSQASTAVAPSLIGRFVTLLVCGFAGLLVWCSTCGM